ncbi:MAG TPA: glycosyltransferase family 4 protein [Pseudacidobacterium sp.]|nr:glycosyltransferase family 4 protein [Pseudacidobacterium sp.]
MERIRTSLRKKRDKPRRYVIAVASLGDYRARVVREIRSRLGSSLTIYAGTPPYDLSIRLMNYAAEGIVPLANRYVGTNILIQRINITSLIQADGLIMDLNPRVPHVWLITAARRILGRPTMLWGHAWPRSGPNAKSDRVRGWLRTLATGLVAYTESQAEGLRSRHPRKFIVAAPNALYSCREMRFNSESRRFRILYVGRLVQDKKPRILIDAFEKMARSAPNTLLTFIGDGPERASMQKRIAESPYRDRIEMPGYISEFEKLRPFYDESLVSVSPGYVGLSITQSLAFGVPMLISRDENHSPEIECAVEGFNSRFFETDNPESLAAALLEFVNQAEAWRQRGPEIASDCARRYSVERMAGGLMQALVGE